MIKITLNKLLRISGSVALILFVIFWIWWRGADITITNDPGDSAKNLLPKSSISGISCDRYNRRPLAIMMASDPETRPLSGISEADLVFEMPVTPNGITRFMAVFQCFSPTEIGSIRSAREDFIPLAAGLDAIYAHWGGEREALARLNSHVINNVDGLKFDGTVFYRKKGIPMPHNGFTNLEKLSEQAKKFEYRLDNKFKGYVNGEVTAQRNLSNIAESIDIEYPHPYNAKWVYNQAKNEYDRFRGDKPETDRNNNSQVTAKVIIVMKTNSTYISKDYIRVATQGEGDALIYQNGIMQSGRWKKDPAILDSKLTFYGQDAKEITFLPGKKWIEIVVSSD